MKITTWNVNGLRAALNKDIWSWVRQENPDIVCLQEIKARPDQISNLYHDQFNTAHIYWNPAEKPGYSGVATFANQPALSVDYGIGRSEFDLEGRVIRSRYPGFILFNVYFPSGQRGHDRVEFKLEFYAHLLEICDHLHQMGERIIMCGDFNTAHREIDLRYPKQNQKTSGFLPEERAWVDTYLAHGFVDVYRTLFPDRVEYTWWTYRMNARQHNVGWRLDYFLTSEALVPLVRDVVIHSDITGSDHCPVTLVIDV
ncbi:MAG: exodeoxyribonuclease III [Chloroflexi bacterium RBG_19FT_COMBO_49_13]|nr:MAG: exodeoxyribonuclease III [Chloroflexi bacterium RBG_19FT_COMBO_49_13]